MKRRECEGFACILLLVLYHMHVCDCLYLLVEVCMGSVHDTLCVAIRDDVTYWVWSNDDNGPFMAWEGC